MKMFESIKYAFEAYKEKAGQGMLYSIILSILNILWFIPIIGPIILAILWPIALRKIADEWGLSIGPMESSETRKAALIVIAIPTLILHIILFSAIIRILSFISSGAENLDALLPILLGNIIALIIWIIIQLTISILFLYSLYALILGKERKMIIDVKKSILIIVLGIIVGVMFNIISIIVGAIPAIGAIIELVLLFLVFPAIGALAMLHYTRSL